MADYAAEQEMELEALNAILMDEISGNAKPCMECLTAEAALRSLSCPIAFPSWSCVFKAQIFLSCFRNTHLSAISIILKSELPVYKTVHLNYGL